MQAQIDIQFEQLVEIVKQLPKSQWAELKHEVEATKNGGESSDLVSLLLSAPTYSDAQLEEVAQTRKSINQWRTK